MKFSLSKFLGRRSEVSKSTIKTSPHFFGASSHKNYENLLLKKVRGHFWPTGSQLRHTGRFLSALEKILTAVAGLALLLGVALLIIQTYFNFTILAPAVGGQYTEAIIGSPHFINPLLASANDADLDIVSLIYSGLLKRDANRRLQPDLAENYEVSLDGKIYTFRLRGGVLWHDGQPFSATDVVYTYEAAINPQINSPLAKIFNGIKIEKIDNHTVRIVLTQPFAPFPEFLTLGILPAHIWNAVPVTNFPHVSFNLKEPVGTGPYKVDKISSDARGNVVDYTLARNDQFYRQKPYLERIKFKFFPDFATAIEAANSKQVDGLSYIPQALKNDLKNPDVARQVLTVPQYRALFFNMNSTGPISNLEVRQALAQATNPKELIRETLGGDGVIVSGPILSGFLGYNPSMKQYVENLDAANNLLDKAGWKLNTETGQRIKTVRITKNKKTTEVVTPLKLTLTTLNRPDFASAADFIKTQWSHVGVQVDVQIVKSDVLARDVIRPRAFEILLFDEILGGDPDPYAFWHSSQANENGLNLANYTNKIVDRLLERGRTSIDLEVRAQAYRDLQDTIRKDLPAIFLMSPKYIYGLSSKVKGFDSAALTIPADRFANIANWYITMRRSWK